MGEQDQAAETWTSRTSSWGAEIRGSTNQRAEMRSCVYLARCLLQKSSVRQTEVDKLVIAKGLQMVVCD
jgi:hypothetical protein